MAISLKKSEKISLTKNEKGLEHVTIRLGWDAKKTIGGRDYDLDASLLMFGDSNNLVEKVYFSNKGSKNRPILGSVYHTGDNLTGDGDGDDEIIDVVLTNVPDSVKELDIIVNIYDARSRKQSFTNVKNAYVRVYDEDNREEFVKYNLSDDYTGLTAIHVAKLVRKGSEWEFVALGIGTKDNSINDLVKNISRGNGKATEVVAKPTESTESDKPKKKLFGLF